MGTELLDIGDGVALSQLGRRTLIVDADMRTPRVHHLFGTEGTGGLSNVLALMAKSLSAVRSGRSFARQRKRAASRGCEGYKPTR